MPSPKSKKKQPVNNPLKPSPELLRKLAIVVIRADELKAPDGVLFKDTGLRTALNDPEVQRWETEMIALNMAPIGLLENLRSLTPTKGSRV